MSGSWSDSEYISSYSFILARGIRSICMITPEMLLPVMWACRSRHRVQIDVQLKAPMTSWHCWLSFIYKWMNALIHIYMATHTRVQACMHRRFCYVLYTDTSVWEADSTWRQHGIDACHRNLLPAWVVPVCSAEKDCWVFKQEELPFFFSVVVTFGHLNK